MRHRRLLGLIAASLGFAPLGVLGDEPPTPTAADAPPLRAATWLNLPAKGWTVADLKGRVVLVEFFETGCVPCKRTLPHIQALHERYTARGLTVVCVSPEAAPVLTAFAREGGYTMPIACDTAKAIIGAYNVQQYPSSVVVDRDGKIAFVGKPMSVDDPLEKALGLELDPGAILASYAAAVAKKDVVGARAGVERLMERTKIPFDLRAWAAAQPAPESPADVPEGGAPPTLDAPPADPAKALAEMLAASTPAARREQIRGALAESGPETFDLLAFAREAYGRAFPLAAKEAKELVAAGRLGALVDALIERRPAPAAVDEAVKAKALAPLAAKKAAEARADARKAVILAEVLFPQESTLEAAAREPYWEELSATGWGIGPEGRMTACDVRGQLLRPTTAPAFVDRSLERALVLESLAAGKKPSLATLGADVAKVRAAIVAGVKTKYAR